MVNYQTAMVTSDDDVELPSEEETLIARLPLLAGSSKKAAYLAFRSCGFSIERSVTLAGTTKTSIQQWRKSDPVFARWEQEKLQELQASIGNDVIRFDFLRNMKLLLHQDLTIIAKAVELGLDKLTGREWEIYKNVRKFYTPSDWLNLEKILAPEKHQEAKIVVNLSWGGRLPGTDDTLIEGTSREVPIDGQFTEIEKELSTDKENRDLLGM